MKSKKIITGITVAEQMRRAKKILKEQVIPREKEYQERKNNEIKLYENIIDWGMKNKYGVNFNADSDIVEYQHININFKTKEIKIS